ncbi:hypothetical protein GJU43_14880 [Flavobacterium sp. LC2016-23]|uniref:hypothetical protein n=1 Tax=Flavobacterium sp. LC2016-23 TaxID=2666330 RepID=UPI0012B07E35|nr:hypothetical protein [Flavobacterium sp. LC2016-23]MRX40571.1 hypothetical protein [Flavobacterium sp. LC2016-23]
MKKIKLYIPTTWDEMTERQFEKIAFLFNTSETSIKFYIKLFFLLNNVKWWQFAKKAKVRIVLRNIPLSDLHKAYEYIFKENNRTVFPKALKAGKTIYFPPQNKIANLTADEFAVIDDLHIKWRETKDLEFLRYMLAVLYTPDKARSVFDKNDLHEKAIPFKKVSLQKLFAVEQAYFGCKNALVKRFPKAFPKPKPGAAKPKKKYGFSKVILTMAKGDLSKLDLIKKVNVYTFLEQFEEDLTPANK